MRGVRPADRGDLVYQVISDALGIYQDPGSDYREIYVPRIPGLVEVTLKAQTVRKPAFVGFASSPYSLRLCFFTNGGVREYEFKAPPVLQDFAETLSQAAERINNCKHRGSSQSTLSLRGRWNPSVKRGHRNARVVSHIARRHPASKQLFG